MLNIIIITMMIFLGGCTQSISHTKVINKVPRVSITVRSDGTLDAENTSKIFKQVRILRKVEAYYFDGLSEHYK